MRRLIFALALAGLCCGNGIAAADNVELRQWSMREVNACFGDTTGTREVESVTWTDLGRDGCRMSIVLDERYHLSIRDWTEAEKGACRRLLHKCDAVLAAANLPGIVNIGGGDAWSYTGEGIGPSAVTCSFIPCRVYCGRGFCAHGKGHLGTDGSWWYSGDFVQGRMEGQGRYENDFYVYVGGFKNNVFDGKGQLDCLAGPHYLGEFSEGRLVSPFESAGLPAETRIKPGEPVGWVGPCE